MTGVYANMKQNNWS